MITAIERGCGIAMGPWAAEAAKKRAEMVPVMIFCFICKAVRRPAQC